jgi:hypothetical protein
MGHWAEKSRWIRWIRRIRDIGGPTPVKRDYR